MILNTKIAKKRIVAIAVLIIMILGSGDSINIGTKLSVKVGLILVNFAITCILAIKKRYISSSMLKVFAVMCMLVIASMITNMDIHGYTMWLLLAVAFLVEETIDYEIFYQQYENLMVWISLFSLVGTVLWFAIPEFVLSLPKIEGVVADIRNLYVTTIPTIYQGVEFRNFGIFREPAMFCIYIGLALLREFFYVENISLRKCVLFLLTIVTTRSMTGYIAVIFLFFMFTFFKKKKKKEYGFCAVILVGVVVIGEAFGLLTYFFDRLDPGGASSYSMNSRIYSIVCGVMAGMTKPIFGRGANKSAAVFSECVALLDIPGGACWANMTTYLFASFGIVFVSAFILGLYGMGLKYSNSKRILWVTLLFIVLLLCGETMTYSALLYTFMMYGLRNIDERRRCRSANV